MFPANDLGRVAGRTLQQVGSLCEHLIPHRPIHLGEDLCVDQPHASPLVKVLQRSQAVRPLPEERVPALGTALQEPDAPALGQISNRQLQFRSSRIIITMDDGSNLEGVSCAPFRVCLPVLLVVAGVGRVDVGPLLAAVVADAPVLLAVRQPALQHHKTQQLNQPPHLN